MQAEDNHETSQFTVSDFWNQPFHHRIGYQMEAQTADIIAQKRPIIHLQASVAN